ncbi:class I SAM-dependent methyltransferase [Acidiferrimicrobium sp. IK]|uniref:class I SAM-dependent methyltransferase n=1 Tax=Acidiferrimicrobium sp. IK TaxID=2871700 RepID=UPI0021CB3B17|nr:class I SAM-dependent methyltransferase [Acidiferrimicrobium sp. IK]MCU4185701.1 class I SAM-dependent methyltransferase [Acidiferrimicrobium sp. IK]
MSVAAHAGSFADRHEALSALARPLSGAGIEIGPGHQPFAELPEGCRVRFVDRYRSWYANRLFPELGRDEAFISVDVRLDVDRKGLGPVRSESEDFVVASHVVEHVANPLRLVAESYRVLAPGGLLLILVPNRLRTFDAGRTPTSLGHVVDEYRSHVERVGLDHVQEFLLHTGELVLGAGTAARVRRQRQLRWHRQRSVHAHCWDEPAFFELLDWLVRHERHAWVLEGMLAPDAYPGSHEFGYLLRRDGSFALDPAAQALRLAAERDRLVSASLPT